MNRSYSYKAVDRSGAIQSATLQAASVGAALEELAQMQMVPLDVRESPEPAIGAVRWLSGLRDRKTTLTAQDVMVLTQALGSLLKAGLMLDRALNIVARTSDRPSVRQVCLDLERRVRAGETLSGALRSHAKHFPSYYAPMVAAGELGGSLAESFGRLRESLERAAALRERLVSAVTYPIILVAMIVVTVILVLTVVLPKFRTLFAESQARLPWATQVVLGLGDFVSDYGWGVGAAVLVIATCVFRLRRHPVHGMRWSAYLVRSRWTFGLISKAETSRLLRTIATLIHGGIPVPDAVGVARSLLANRALRSATDRIFAALKEGVDLSRALENEGVFPQAAVQLSKVGEETGRLEELLTEAANILDRETEQTIERILNLAVPIVTIVMGALVAALVGSVLVGILSLNDLAL